jgi:hypothetical protein
MDHLDLLMRLHGQVQPSEVGPPEPNDVSYADHLLKDLDDAQMRLRPAPMLNSCAWLLWHITRAEDIGINTMVAGRAQVLDEGDWQKKIGSKWRDIGTGMSSDDVTSFSNAVDISALRAYRQAVGSRTRESVRQLGAADWDAPVPAANLERAMAEGAFLPQVTPFMSAFWSGRPMKWFLWQPSGHSFLHLGEVACVRSVGGFPAFG